MSMNKLFKISLVLVLALLIILPSSFADAECNNDKCGEGQYCSDGKCISELWKPQGLADSAKAGVAAFGAGSVSSMLIGSLTGLDSKSSGAISGFGGLGAGLGAFVGNYFGGAAGGMIGGPLAGLLGGVIGMATTRDKTLQTIARDISFKAEYLIMPTDTEQAITLNSPKFKRGGEPENTLGITHEFKDDKAYIQDNSGAKFKVYPIGFSNEDEGADWLIKSGLLNIDYDKLDVNLLISQDRLTKDIKYDEINNQEKVEKRDAEVQEEYEERALNNDYMFDSFSSFMLFFRNIAPEDSTYNIPNISCLKFDGTTGATGPEARPKVVYNWNYESTTSGASEIIKVDFDNQGMLIQTGTEDGLVKKVFGKNTLFPEDYSQEPFGLCSAGVYCDSVQFTNEIVHRLSLLDNIDSADEGLSSFSSELTPEIPDEQVPVRGSVELAVNELSITLENQTFEEIEIDYTVTLKDVEIGFEQVAGTGTITIDETYELDNLESITDLDGFNPDSRYRVIVDIIKRGTTFESSKIQSEIFNFREKSSGSSTDTLVKSTDEENYKLLNFRVNLMADGYTQDFIEDYKEYVLNGSSMNFTDSAKGIVSNIDRIEFMPDTSSVSSPQGYVLENAGNYNVKISVNFKSPEDTTVLEPDGTISDAVESIQVKLDLATIDRNPIYYMPMDGMIGVVGGSVEREGYGSAFSGDSLFFTQGQDTLMVHPGLTTNSTPKMNIEINAYENDYERFNRTNRGSLLTIAPAGTGIKRISYAPNLPARVAMKMTKESEGPAYSFYTMHTQDGPINTGPAMLAWRLYCGDDESDITNFTDYDCEYFDGRAPIDLQGDAWDISGTRSETATGSLANFAYGLEVPADSVIRDSAHKTATLRSIFYSSPTANLKIAGVAQSDSVAFSQEGSFTENDSEVSLTPLDNRDDITTVQKIYNLVSDGAVCVSGSSNDSTVDFWWNPAYVFCNSDTDCLNETTLVN